MGKANGEAGANAARGDSALEIELKLGGDPAALDRGWRAAVPAGGGSPSRRLRSTYFDTGDFRLRRRGFTLRIREEGERLVQTLKSDGPSSAGAVLKRNEWSRTVEAPVPSLPVVSDPAIRDAIGPLQAAELAPAFSTDVMRRTAVVEVTAPDHGTALVELALDSGEIRAQNRVDTIAELELELIEGPASALYELAMTLQAAAPLSIQTASKAKRGYVLAGGESYAGYKAPALALAEGISVDEALGKIFRTCANQCAANHDAVLDRSDPEGVHQFSRLSTPDALGPRGLQDCSSGRERRLVGAGGLPFLSNCLARHATGTCLSPRRSPRSGALGRTTALSSVSQLRPRRNGHAPTSRRRRCARQNTRHSCSALAGGLRSRVGGARRTAPYSTSRLRVSGGPCSTGGTSGCLSADAISRDSRTTVFTGSGSRSRSCVTRASFSPLNSLTASRAPISTLCAGFRTTSADSTTLPSLSVV